MTRTYSHIKDSFKKTLHCMDRIQQKRTKVPFSDVLKAFSHKWVKNVANQKTKILIVQNSFFFQSKKNHICSFPHCLKKATQSV